MAGSLEGVLELTRVGPGAFRTMRLADMGAGVLKIEPSPARALRGSGASPGPDEARTLATSFTNRNRRSLPHIGQHTGEVLYALDYSKADVARLREQRVV